MNVNKIHSVAETHGNAIFEVLFNKWEKNISASLQISNTSNIQKTIKIYVWLNYV